MKGKLTLADLLLMATMTQSEAVEYAKDQGVDIADDYGNILELIAYQSYEIYAYTKLQLLQLLLDISKSAETIEDVQEVFEAKTTDYTGDFPFVAENASIINGYNSYSDSQRRTEKKFEVYLYVSVIDGTTTTGCKVLNNKVFKYSDTNAVKYLYPPRHWGCRAMHLALKSYTGKISDSITYKQYWSEPPFVKTDGGYKFKPNSKDYDSDLFKAYENE